MHRLVLWKWIYLDWSFQAKGKRALFNWGTLKNHISEQQLLHYQQFLDEKEQLIRRYHMQYVKLTLAELIPEIEVFLHYANKLAAT